MADTMQDNLQGRLKEMKSALEDIAITIYENIKPSLEFLISLIKNLANWFSNLSPGMQNTIIVIAGLAAAIGPLLIVLGLMSSGIGAIMTAFSALMPIITGAGAAIGAISAPVLIAIGAITALIAIGIALYKNWDEVSEWLKNIWNKIKAGASVF